MGYYTDFCLDFQGVKEDQRSALTVEIEKMNIFDGGNIDDGFFCNAKWYDHNEDMLLLSTRFPNILFSLHGYGEDSGDIWLNYFKAGRVMYEGLKLIQQDFDENQLSDDRLPEGVTNYSYEELPTKFSL